MVSKEFSSMTHSHLPFSNLREELARAIHEKYRQEQEGETPPEDPAMRPWESLPEDLKESNRQQADQIPEKLRLVGLLIRPAQNAKPAGLALSPDELDKLARLEHDRWMAQKLAQGWTCGPVKDPVRKLHPSLVPWEDLPEAEKDKDRKPVQNIPEFLAAVGLEAYRCG
jgi:hypothetical protein